MARDLRLFYLFRLLATSYLWAPLFVFFMSSRGLAFDEVMLLSVAYSVVVILVEVPTGALADRIGRRHSMMLGALAMSASCIVSYNAYTMGAFLVAEVLAATSMALCSGADSAYLFDLLDNNGRGHEYARREGHASAVHLFGSMAACAAGGLLGAVDLSLPYLVNAGTAGIAFVIALSMRDEKRRKNAELAPLGQELRAYVQLMGRSLGDVIRNRKLAWIIFYSAVVFALLRVTVYLYQPYLDARGFPVWQTGLIYAGGFAIAAVMALRADALRRWLGEGALVWGLLATLAVSFLLLQSIAGPLALAFMAVQYATKGVYSPLVKPILNREISDSGRRATVLSVESIARRVAIGAVSLVAAAYGAYYAIYICGGLGLAGFALLLVVGRWAPGRKHPVMGKLETPPAVVEPVEATAD